MNKLFMTVFCQTLCRWYLFLARLVDLDHMLTILDVQQLKCMNLFKGIPVNELILK